ncbi:MAG: peptidase M14 [Bacteroidia bacterium]|nr:peptidase M14 [Bacteroidia bacterium]
MIRISTLLFALMLPFAAHGFTPQELWRAWPEERFETTVAPCLRHARLMDSLQELESRFPDSLRMEEVGKSFLGRSIRMLALGRGEQKILLWSQMHGDEPSATPALLDIANYLLEHADEPAARSILDGFTLLMIPMLNPDGAEVYERRNAQAIDINRDALNLTTPEGRTLKRVRDDYEPLLGFNLHDQNRRIAVGDTGLLATNAVLAVAGDPENTLTPGRLRAKRACAAIVGALAPFMPGGMARYDEDWSPRAFGDNLTAWGTPVVLIESGGVPSGHEFTVLTRLNFVAILTVLHDLARDDLAGHDPQVYEDLLRNQSNSWSDVVVRDGYLQQPGTDQAYHGVRHAHLLQPLRSLAGLGFFFLS